MARTLQMDVRSKILSAAEDRLWHYGFKKTTIDEIAADAGVGKGTVYLYFDSKEDIALAIMAQFKMTSLASQQTIARDPMRDPQQKLKDILISPALSAFDRCERSPNAVEMVVAVRPHIQARLRPYLEQEIALIAEVLEEGNQSGSFDVFDTMQAARSLKLMCSGFWPPYPCVTERSEVETQIGNIISLAIKGLRK